MDDLPHRDGGEIVDNIVASLNQHSSSQRETEWDEISPSDFTSRQQQQQQQHHHHPSSSSGLRFPITARVSSARSRSGGSVSTVAGMSTATAHSPTTQPADASTSIFEARPSPIAAAHSSSASRTSPGRIDSPSSAFPIQPVARSANSTPRRRPLVLPPEAALDTSFIPDAEKDMDDPTTPVQRKSSDLDTYHTPTSLTKLLGAHTSITPGSSRAPSYNHGNVNLLRRPTDIEGASLPDHLYTRGLLGGRHSDVAILAFGNRYNLHRLILDRAPFFALAFSEPWRESFAKEVELYPSEVDPSITQNAFELALKRLYGCDISTEEDSEAVGLFATGCWLEMQELIDSSVESILRQMCPENLASIIKLVTNNYYGRPGERILSSAKAMLCRDGWDMPLRYWDFIPGHIVQEVVASDGFFVVGEWERWNHARRVLDRRLKQHGVELGLVGNGIRSRIRAPGNLMRELPRFNPFLKGMATTFASRASTTSDNDSWLAVYLNPDIESLLSLLDEGIHYVHLSFEQLQYIRKSRDIFGLPIVPDAVCLDALYMQMELRQRVVNSKENDPELGLCRAFEPKDSQDRPPTTASADRKGKKREPTDVSSTEEEQLDIFGSPTKRQKFWIPSADCNMIMGGNADPVISTASSSSALRIASRHSAAADPPEVQWTSEISSPFSTRDLTARPRTPGSIPSSELQGPSQPTPISYSNFPPFRFSAEFPAPRLLKEKKRVYSRTVFYAGSLWNIYIQKMRGAKQNFQLGVYLHRAKERDQDESISGDGLGSTSVDERIGVLEREMLLRGERHSAPFHPRARAFRGLAGQGGGSGNDAANRSSPTLVGSNDSARSSAASTMGLYSRRARDANMQSRFSDATMQTYMSFDTDSSDSDSSVLAAMGLEGEPDDGAASGDLSRQSTQRSHNEPFVPPRVSTVPAYTDARPTIRTYFKIYSPSKAGRLLSVYESAPDQFDFSQSWGWRSSTLMIDEGFSDESGNDDPVTTSAKRSRAGMLRFSVVIGNL